MQHTSTRRPRTLRGGFGLLSIPFILVFLFPCCFLMVFLLFGGAVEKMTAQPVSGTITNLYPVPTSQNGTMAYRVHVQLDNETTEVFNLTASIAFGQLDVPTVYGQLNKGDHISFTATGLKLNGIGVYRNMVKPHKP